MTNGNTDFDENTLLEAELFADPEDISSRTGVPAVVVKRLPRYYRYLRELILAEKLRVSSGELSRMLGVTASQIRQDFNCFGDFGQQGYGYNVRFLYRKISEILGVTKGYNAVIVGSGNLGRALAGSHMFAKRGVNLLGLFDVSPDVIGSVVSGYRVMPISDAPDFCRENGVSIAVLTTPGDAAAAAARMFVDAGVRGIWNFTNKELDIPQPGVKTENVHMGDSLMMLCYSLSEGEE